MPTPIETNLGELKNKSEPINDSLWYVNPKDIESALKDIWNEALEAVEKEIPQETTDRKWITSGKYTGCCGEEAMGWNECRSETLGIIKRNKI